MMVHALTTEAKEGDCGGRGIPPQNAKTGGISCYIRGIRESFLREIWGREIL